MREAIVERTSKKAANGLEARFDDEVGLSLLGYSRAGAKFRSYVLDQRAWSLLYIHHGSMTIEYDGSCETVAAGDVLLFDPFMRYRLDGEDESSCDYLYIRFTFRFEPDRSIRDDLRQPRLDDRQTPGLRDQLDVIAKLFESLDTRAADDTRLAAARLAAHQAVLTLVQSITTREPATDAARENDLVRHVRRFLARHVNGPISLTQVASAFHLSQAHLTRRFRDATGMTIKQCHEAMRLQRAADQLVHSDRTVTQVADDLGFSTVHHLSRRFKRHFGVSPIQYRTDRGRPHGPAPEG